MESQDFTRSLESAVVGLLAAPVVAIAVVILFAALVTLTGGRK
jgi:hypothetical protein